MLFVWVCCPFPFSKPSSNLLLQRYVLPEHHPRTCYSARNLRDNDLLLTEDTFSGLVNLESLDIFSTGLASLPEGFASLLPALTSLNLGSNKLLLTGDSFSGLENLEILTLSGNELSSLPEALFSALTALITLNLGGNPLLLAEDIFSGLVNLETLNLGNSGLTTLPAGLFSPLVNMTTLVVSRNTDIQCIPASTATDIVSTFIDLPDGACECTPVEAVFCADGLICQSGMTGYTCVAE